MPMMQSKIEAVSDLRLRKFGNIAESLWKFSAELSADFIILEPRGGAQGAKSPATGRIIAIQTGQTKRPDWLAGSAV
jgi:hypothetical protein